MKKLNLLCMLWVCTQLVYAQSNLNEETVLLSTQEKSGITMASTTPEYPFHKGVGFSQAFETGTSVYDIYFNYYTREDFVNVKRLGIDEVRLPIFMANMVQENGEMSPLFFYLLDQYVDMAEEEGVNLILTNMSAYDYSDVQGLRTQFLNMWTQMAQHYKDRSALIHYELANEPSGISDEDWGSVQGDVIDAIREIDSIHTIIVTPAMWGSVYHLELLPEYDDDNLIYGFHCYDPFLFTHQGAASQGFEELTGVPFPYDPDRMPPMPSSFIGTWDEERYNDYSSQGTVEALRSLVEVAAAFKNERNVRVWCGEFGADDQYSNIDDRALWYETLRTAIEENGMAWSMHGYTRYWGVFEYGTWKLFDYDLNIPIVEAMGLNVIPQSEFTVKPDTTELDIYDDYVSPHIYTWISSEEGTSHFYSEEDPHEGKFCFYTEDLPIWSFFDFRFEPERDLSELVANNYGIEFWVKGDTPGAKFNVRFLDTDTDDPDDHPWRIVHDVDETMVQWDNNWHLIQIPLADFVEQGSGDDGTWYDSEGKFDWKAVGNFQITTEFHSFEGMKFWFDDIKIVKLEEPEAINITFQVDMQNEEVSSSGVYLNGSFCNWDPDKAIQLTANGLVYSTILQLTAGETVEYKFVNGAATDWGQYEILSGSTCAFGNDSNRGLVVPETDSVLTAVCFEACSTCLPNAVNDFKTDIVVYPNPTTGKVLIEGLAANKKSVIKLFSIEGSLLFETVAAGNGTEIVDLSSFPAGYYSLTLISDNGCQTYKILKN